MHPRIKFSQLLAFFTSIMVLACIANEPPQKTPPTDTSNPEAVAKAFIIALAKKDIQLATQFVIPEQREELRKELEKGVPPLPKAPKIKVRVKKDGLRADVSVLNVKRPKAGPPFGLDMKLSDGKWWIVK
ncbi:MAG: hypothetical protein AB8F34_04095 [Akkermansiaceae bacterium]